MPLDAESLAVLRDRRNAAVPGVAAQSLAEVRASREAWRSKSADPPAPVHSVADTHAGTVPVRLYRPDARTSLPALVYFHGGGWVLGDLEHSDGICRHLCAEIGCIVVNVDYRLAPEHRYPAAAEDSFSALKWIHDEAANLGVDARRLGIAGSSAGGNLAAVCALMARDRGGPACQAQLLVYPVLDQACAFPSFTEFGDGYIVSTTDMRWYWEQYLAEPSQGAEPYASPLRAPDLSGLPPALVITAECDPVRDDGEAYAERLRADGVPVRLTRYPGTLHGFFANPGTLPKARLAVTEAAGFLRDALGLSEAQ